MFDIGGIEFLIVLIVALLVVGPKELPALLRTLGKYAGMLKKQASEFRSQFDDVLKESEFSDIKKDFETMGEEAQAEMRDVESSVSEGLDEFDDHSNLDDDDFKDIDDEFEALDDGASKDGPGSSGKQKSKSATETDSGVSQELTPDHDEPSLNGTSVSNGHDHVASSASNDAGNAGGDLIAGEDLGTERKSGT